MEYHVPKTLLAIDDSATMRKVFEITFKGDEFRTVTASTAAIALASVREEAPHAVLIDIALENNDGYALCKEVRKLAPNAAIIMLSSRFHPHDPVRGSAAGADASFDKPFETATAIEKVRQAIAAKNQVSPAISSLELPSQLPLSLAISSPEAAPCSAPAVSLAISSPAAGSSVARVPTSDTMSGELARLGLSQAQVNSVMTLSREMIEKTVEKVVWEVVPQLAEALIREEIARVMREG